jgi:DNA-binding NarL/FixJ family response regulator
LLVSRLEFRPPLAEPVDDEEALCASRWDRHERRHVGGDPALTQALELFDQLGAALWAERAASELARIPGRAPAGEGLTGTERQVAELVALGLSNKEVAASLSVTVRTVEFNLTKIYSKFGLRSRSELARRLHSSAADR